MIPIDMIEAGSRLRGTAPEQVAAIAASIAEVGLLHPIAVYARPVIRAGIEVQGWGIVAGLHRLEACRGLGWTEIPAHVVTLGELERQLAECDENLCGPKLSKAERALFTTRRKQAYEALHPETRQGGAPGCAGGGKVSKDAKLASFAEDTAAKTGQSERAVQRDAARGARIDEDVLTQVRGTAQDTGRTLDALAAVPKDQQAAELGRLRISQGSNGIAVMGSLSACDRTRDPEEQFAEIRQTVVDTLYQTLENAKHGWLFPGFLIEAIENEVWKHPRKLTHNTLPPMPLREFVKRSYPTGLGASFEMIEKLVAGDERAMLAWDKAVRGEHGLGSAAEAEEERAKRKQRLRPLAQAVAGLGADRVAALLIMLPQHQERVALMALLREAGL